VEWVYIDDLGVAGLVNDGVALEKAFKKHITHPRKPKRKREDHDSRQAKMKNPPAVQDARGADGEAPSRNRPNTMEAPSSLKSPKNASLDVQSASDISPSDGNQHGTSSVEKMDIPEDQRHFYLLKPHTPSNQAKVLIALDPSKSLFELLQDQNVLEFPTIVVLPQSPDKLPPGYIIDDDYLRKAKSESNSVLDKLLSHMDTAETYSEALKPDEDKALEESKILEAMKKDFGPLA
jgi:hypothetical protein